MIRFKLHCAVFLFAWKSLAQGAEPSLRDAVIAGDLKTVQALAAKEVHVNAARDGGGEVSMIMSQWHKMKF